MTKCSNSKRRDCEGGADIYPHYAQSPQARQLIFLLMYVAVFAISLISYAREDSSAGLAPLLYTRHTETGDLEASAFFSLFNLERTTDTMSIKIPLLYSYQREYRGTYTESSHHALLSLIRRRKLYSYDPLFYRSRFLIFPLYWTQTYRTPSARIDSTQILPLYYHRSKSDEGVYNIFFPFYWKGHNVRPVMPIYSNRAIDFFALFPLYGNFEGGLWGRDYIRFYLWPLVTMSEKDRIRSTHFPWPFLGVFTGEGGGGVKLWPLFGYLRRVDGSIRSYFLWPLGHYRKQIAPETGMIKQKTFLFLPFYAGVDMDTYRLRYYFPLYGRAETPSRLTKAYLFPLLTATQYKQKDERELRFLLMLMKWREGSSRQLRELFPLFMSDLDTKSRRYRSYILFPFYRYYKEWDDEERDERRYLFPLLIHTKQVDHNDVIKARDFVLFPLFGYRRQNSGATLFRLLWLFWYTGNETIERNLAPLWTLYEYRRNANGDIRISALWHILNFQATEDDRCYEINPLLFRYLQSREKTEFNILGGLLGFKKDSEKSAVKILYIPIRL